MLLQEIERRDQIDFLRREEELAQPAYLFSRFHQPYDKDTFGISYAAGIDGAADYVSVGYGIDAGPGSFSIAYGDYEDTSNDFLIGYDWGVGGDFGIGVYYYDLEMEDGAGDSGVTLTISYAP